MRFNISICVAFAVFLLLLSLGIYLLINNSAFSARNSTSRPVNVKKVATSSLSGWSGRSLEISFLNVGHYVWSLDVSPKSYNVAIGVKGGRIFLFDWKTSRLTSVLAHKAIWQGKDISRVNDLNYDPSGQYIVSAGATDNTAIVWNTDNMSIVHVLADSERQILSSQFVWPGSNVITTSMDSRIREYGLRSGALLDEWQLQSGKPLYLTSARYSTAIVYTNESSIFLSTQNKGIISKALPIGSAIRSLAISPYGDNVACGFEDGTIITFTIVKDGVKNQHSFMPDGNYHILEMDYSPCGNYLAVGNNYGEVMIYSFVNNSVVLRYNVGRWSSVNAMRFSNDGEFLCAGTADGRVYFFSEY